MGSWEIRSNPSRAGVGGAVLLGLRAAAIEATSLEAEFLMVMIDDMVMCDCSSDYRFVVQGSVFSNITFLYTFILLV
jgi:hypothetical protein